MANKLAASSGAIGTLKAKMGSLKQENDNLKDENDALKKKLLEKDSEYGVVSADCDDVASAAITQQHVPLFSPKI